MASDAAVRRPHVKICGLTRREDAELAIRLGADFVGFVLTAGFGRSVPERGAGALATGLDATRVAVLVDEPVSRAAELARSIGAGIVQLHGDESPDVVSEMRAAGDWRVWKAVRARSVETVARAVLDYGDVADGVLVEGWKEGVLGGGGATLDLDPARVREAIPEGLTFVLAGGLTPESVAAAIDGFRPDVVDVSSGVERTPGQKDEYTMRRFLAAARGAQENRSIQW